MDKIAEAISRVKQATYAVCRRLPELRQCAAVLEGMAETDALQTKALDAQDAATKITGLMAAIHSEVETLEDDYRGVPDLREISLRSAPPSTKVKATRPGAWHGDGFAGKRHASLSPTSRGVSCAIRLGTEQTCFRPAPRSLDRESTDLAGTVSAGG